MDYQIRITNLSKSYAAGSLTVLSNLNLTLLSGHTYCLMGASGSGKTTLLRILLGLENTDTGSIAYVTAPSVRFTAVFQENRLCEQFSPIDNILLVTGKSLGRDDIQKELSRLLPEESLTRPVSTLSGGMKRRVAIARALLAPSDAVLMDEPFAGLDEDTKGSVIRYIKEKAADKLLLVTTHQEEDIALLGGELLLLS